ncbi:hypothetical protein GGS23DRAFT_128400 [Durotheca rogersii]|uniref:uncharacterized protein n=1 Tax=Durotheca rogersii TaxID=419775 RepID=UPI00221F0D4A|nr:uncharacterized protein GGS23DRAFT_128400 [Durotheca rogersii]KAI5861719.1 hypothetical protein GGS23DRAFT_128400 [Durotheca rogersii]
MHLRLPMHVCMLVRAKACFASNSPTNKKRYATTFLVRRYMSTSTQISITQGSSRGRGKKVPVILSKQAREALVLGYVAVYTSVTAAIKPVCPRTNWACPPPLPSTPGVSIYVCVGSKYVGGEEPEFELDLNASPRLPPEPTPCGIKRRGP